MFGKQKQLQTSNRMKKMLFVVVGLAAMFAASTTSVAEDPAPAEEAGTVSYYNQIRPILQASCQGCHQPARAGGGLVLTQYTLLLEPGESEEPLFVAGKPDESLFIAHISGDDPLMPQEADPLAADQIELIRQWILEGAKDDSPASASVVVDADHPPVYDQMPVVTALDFSPDGALLAVSGHHEVLLHKADGSELIGRLIGLSSRIESLSFSPDGQRLAVTGGSPGRFGELQVWNVAERKLLYSISITFDTIYGASWSPDGKLIAMGCADNTLRAVDSETGKEVLFQGAHADWVLDTVFSIDGSHLLSVSRDRSMKLTEVATQRFVDNVTSITPGALKGGLAAVDRRPEKDELLIGGADGIPKLYQMYRTKDRKIGDDYNLIRPYEAMSGRIFDVAFSRDGSQLVAASSANRSGQVHVYHTDEGKIVAKCAGQSGPVYAVSFHPEGKVVASAGFDGKVRLNDAATGAIIREFVPVPMVPDAVANSQ